MSLIVTGGSDHVGYVWERSVDNSNWSQVGGTQDSTYQASEPVAGTYFYRATVIDSAAGCLDPTSNTLSITVLDDPTISLSALNDSLCVGGVSELSAAVAGGSGQWSYQWQSSPDNSVWIDIPDATYDTLSCLLYTSDAADD